MTSPPSLPAIRATATSRPDCDLRDPARSTASAARSTTRLRHRLVNTTYADDVLNGFGVRPYTWQGSATVQQELRPSVALMVGYFRTSVRQLHSHRQPVDDAGRLRPVLRDRPGGFTPSRTAAGTPSAVCTTSGRRGSGRRRTSSGRRRISGTRRRSTTASTSSLNARFGGGVYVLGRHEHRPDGDGRLPRHSRLAGQAVLPPDAALRCADAVQGQRRVSAAVLGDPGQRDVSEPAGHRPDGDAQCREQPDRRQPWKEPLGVRVGGHMHTECGRAECVRTEYAARRPVDAGRSSPHESSELGRSRVRGAFEIYNLFNDSTITLINPTYTAAAWAEPRGIVPGRLFKFGAQYRLLVSFREFFGAAYLGIQGPAVEPTDT